MTNLIASTSFDPVDRKVELTDDGSHTIILPNTEIRYHSRFGAIQESEHVYLNAGLQPFLNFEGPVRVFEMGFGTGLNAFLTYLAAKENSVKIEYEAVEAFPLVQEEYKHLNYAHALGKRELSESFQMMHQVPWNKLIRIGSLFTMIKHQVPVEQFTTGKKFHVVYYDAFSPTAQPELWGHEAMSRMYDLLLPNGILTTYCSKGDVKRTLESVGFLIEKLPGPLGKREILRAHKPAL
ncbi:MAG TPA: tRNA (5-methylaminomethyl-2-thiouridine)(34)-methyltransferase MnmD [Phnomibacter sp.]|nr:tRNA (5-methylaminomethyl-2-thiouridine)(34)-methyltransferase MnmD [Phnomibacter sp.]